MTQGLKPRYCQIRDDLMAAIREQRILPNEQIPTEVEIMKQYGVSRCYYGHLHGDSHKLAREGEFEGVEFHLVSADYLDFRPKPVVLE